MKPPIIKIDVVFQTNGAHGAILDQARLSPPLLCSFFFTSLLFFFYDRLLLPTVAAYERLFLAFTWLLKDVKFILCHGFSGRKLLFRFLPPNLLSISFSVSSCCPFLLTSILSFPHITLCVSLSYQYQPPPASHLHTSLYFTFYFLSLFHHFLLGKERKKSSSLVCHHLQHSASLSVEETFKVAPHSLGYKSRSLEVSFKILS